MASVALSVLRTRCKRMADMEASSFVSDAEWLAYINAAADEYHGLLARSMERYLETDSASTLTTGSTEDLSLSALSPGLLKLMGVDMQVNGKWRPVDPFPWDERNELRNITATSGSLTRYCLRATGLKLLPVPTSGLSVRVNYVPQRTQFTADGDTIEGYNGWEEYIVVLAARRAMAKEESDTTFLDRELVRLETRIKSEASMRDALEPKRMRDCDEEDWNELREEALWRRGG
jgi:hypothetical protein